jgi:hypothetical protein
MPTRRSLQDIAGNRDPVGDAAGVRGSAADDGSGCQCVRLHPRAFASSRPIGLPQGFDYTGARCGTQLLPRRASIERRLDCLRLLIQLDRNVVQAPAHRAIRNRIGQTAAPGRLLAQPYRRVALIGHAIG